MRYQYSTEHHRTSYGEACAREQFIQDRLCGRYRLPGKPPPLGDTNNSKFRKNVMRRTVLVRDSPNYLSPKPSSFLLLNPLNPKFPSHPITTVIVYESSYDPESSYRTRGKKFWHSNADSGPPLNPLENGRRKTPCRYK